MQDIREALRQKYAESARRVATGNSGSCCGTLQPAGAGCDPLSANLYEASEAGSLPEAAVRASLGCGNPTALAEFHAGDVVLDLGSGGGIDVLLSANHNRADARLSDRRRARLSHRRRH